MQSLNQTVKNSIFADFLLLSLDEKTLEYTARLSDKAKLKELMLFLRENKNLQFQTLLDVCAVDYIGRKKRFEVIYHLLSLTLNHRIRLKIQLKQNETLETVSTIYQSSTWYEREVYDLYGIEFDNHPDMRRILTDYDFIGPQGLWKSKSL